MFLSLLLGSLYVNEIATQLQLEQDFDGDESSTTIEITINLDDVRSIRVDAQDRRDD